MPIFKVYVAKEVTYVEEVETDTEEEAKQIAEDNAVLPAIDGWDDGEIQSTTVERIA